eukprot:g40167.t1
MPSNVRELIKGMLDNRDTVTSFLKKFNIKEEIYKYGCVVFETNDSNNVEDFKVHLRSKNESLFDTRLQFTHAVREAAQKNDEEG